MTFDGDQNLASITDGTVITDAWRLTEPSVALSGKSTAFGSSLTPPGLPSFARLSSTSLSTISSSPHRRDAASRANPLDCLQDVLDDDGIIERLVGESRAKDGSPGGVKLDPNAVDFPDSAADGSVNRHSSRITVPSVMLAMFWSPS